MRDPIRLCRGTVVGGLLIASVVAALLFWDRKHDTSSQIRPQTRAGQDTPTAVMTTTEPRRSPDRASLLIADKRKALLSAMNLAREQRKLAPTKPQNDHYSTRAQRVSDSTTVANPTVLNLANKTGSDTDWDRDQIGILNELLGECFDIAKVQTPDLAGTIGLEFTLRGEPDVGGLVEGIKFVTEHSSITDPQMRECMQESLYALELNPPVEGVEVTRMITMRFSDDEE